MIEFDKDRFYRKKWKPLSKQVYCKEHPEKAAEQVPEFGYVFCKRCIVNDIDLYCSELNFREIREIFKSVYSGTGMVGGNYYMPVILGPKHGFTYTSPVGVNNILIPEPEDK